MTISQLFANIEKTAGVTDKSVLMQQALQDAKIAPIITQIYQDTYDSQRKYGVHKFEIIDTKPMVRKCIELDYKDFHALLDKLANRELTGNDAVYAVGNMIGTFEHSDWPILTAILNKKLTIGLSKTTFEKLTGTSTQAKDFAVTLACHLEGVKGVNPIDGTWYASRKVDGCVSGDTIVELENGVRLPIAEVVDKRMKCKIKSFDETTGKIVYSDIIDWMHNVEDSDPAQKQWYEIELENGRKLKITGNDSVYVKNKGWVKVENLTNDDELLLDD